MINTGKYLMIADAHLKSDKKSQTGGQDMRQIEQDIVQAVRFGKSFHSGTSSNYKLDATGYRDSLHFEENIFAYRLWGNVVAKGDTHTKKIIVSDCGYATATTVSRLNAVFAGLDIPMSCAVKNNKMVYFLHGNPVNENVISAGDWKVKVI